MSQSAASQKWFNPRTALASAALLAVLGVAGCSGIGMRASSTSSVVKVTNDTLTDQHGMALHMFDRNATADKSTCNGKRAENWSLLVANDVDRPSGDHTVITRDDGKKQWAYRGKPFYLRTKDKVLDDQIDDGFMNVWYVAKP